MFVVGEEEEDGESVGGDGQDEGVGGKVGEGEGWDRVAG